MNPSTFFQSFGLIEWVVLLVVSIPFAAMLLGELAYFLRKRNTKLAKPVETVKNVVLPLAAAILVLTHVLEVGVDSLAIKVLSTVIWIIAINAALAFFNAYVFSGSGGMGWRSKVPQLFLDIFRVFMVLLGAAIVLSTVWGMDLGNLVTALGLGSFVLGLALQDTLGNLFMGIALVYEKPFETGDIIEVDDKRGRVDEMNWRAIRLRTKEDEMLVIPHLVIGQSSVKNITRLTTQINIKQEIAFSIHIPPNRVKEALLQACLSTPNIDHDPEPEIKVNEIKDDRIVYEVEYRIGGYVPIEAVMDDFLTRAWYVAQRAGLDFPKPHLQIFQPPEQAHTQSDSLDFSLQKLPKMLPVDQKDVEELRDGARVLHFGNNETILRQDDATGALYVILSGTVDVFSEKKGENHWVCSLREGEFFGEVALFSSRTSTFTIVATSDLEVVYLPSDEVADLVQRNPKVARQLDNMMDARRRMLERK